MINKLNFGPINPGLPVSQIEATSETQLYLALIYKVNECIDKINQTLGYEFPNIIADEYNPLKSYTKGEYCLYNFDLYYAISDSIAGEFVPQNWSKVNISDILVLLRKDILANEIKIDEIDNILAEIETDLTEMSNEIEDLGDQIVANLANSGSFTAIPSAWNYVTYTFTRTIPELTDRDSIIVSAADEDSQDILAGCSPFISANNDAVTIKVKKLPNESITFNYTVIKGAG